MNYSWSCFHLSVWFMSVCRVVYPTTINLTIAVLQWVGAMESFMKAQSTNANAVGRKKNMDTTLTAADRDHLIADGWRFGTEKMNDMPLITVQEMYVIESGKQAGEAAYRDKQGYDYEKRTVKVFLWAQHDSLPLSIRGIRSYIVGDSEEELLGRIHEYIDAEADAQG